MSIEVISGTFSYRNESPVLSDVSFSVETGEIAAVLGPNGAGKTTLLKCMLGFLNWKRGNTLLDGKDILEYKGRKFWQIISYVPQARESVFSLNTMDMVILGRSPYIGNFSMPGKKDREIAHEVMEMAGITHLIGKSCSQISGGELQLVLIARALAAKPRVLILDEPESGLDFKNQIAVLDLLKKLSDEQGMTVVVNTHYPDHALRISDKSLILFGNGMHLFGKTQTILTEEHMRMAFGIDIAVSAYNVNGKEYKAVIPLEISECK